jgi:hypothetical protein
LLALGCGFTEVDEEHPEQDPVGLDPQKRFTEVDEDSGMEIPLGLRLRYLMP